jgi:hypothetical protein
MICLNHPSLQESIAVMESKLADNTRLVKIAQTFAEEVTF